MTEPSPTGWADRMLVLRARLGDPAARGAVTAVAVAVFVVATTVSLAGLPADRDSLDPLLIGVAAVLVVPGVVVNAEEYRVSARILGQRVAFVDGMRVAVVAAAGNLLPLPGAALVRTGALHRGGSTARRAAGSTLSVGAVYLGVALVVVGVVQTASAPTPAIVAGLAGLAIGGLGGVTIARLAGPDRWRVLRHLVVVELASVGIKAVRLHVVISALGFHPSITQAVSLSMATVAASAIGVFPGGLGIRELLAGSIAPAVGLSAAIGLLSSAVERVLGLAVLAVVAVAVLGLPGRTGPPLAEDA